MARPDGGAELSRHPVVASPRESHWRRRDSALCHRSGFGPSFYYRRERLYGATLRLAGNLSQFAGYELLNVVQTLKVLRHHIRFFHREREALFKKGNQPKDAERVDHVGFEQRIV